MKYFGDLDKKSRIALYCSFMPIVGLLVYSIGSAFFGPSTMELIQKDRLALDFHGTVDSLYHDEMNHNVLVAILSSGYQYKIKESWEYKIHVGNSLSKNAGSYKLDIIAKRSKKVTLDYRDKN